MIVGGFSYAGTLARPNAAPAIPAASGSGFEDEGEIEAGPAYFRTISSISHGSLAAAYQAIRAQEVGTVETEANDDGVPQTPEGDTAILSGLGIPAALAAYGEVIEVDEA